MAVNITEDVKRRIQELSRKREGRIAPEDVVEDARSKKSPLHKCFDWDDASAAAKHRLHTARQLITSVRVNIVYETQEISVVGYARDPDLYGTQTSGYREIERIAEDEDDAGKLFANEIERCESIIMRSIDIAKALGLETEARKVIRQLANMRKKAD